MTRSPALTPDRISTLVPSLTPMLHRPSPRLRASCHEHGGLFTVTHHGRPREPARHSYAARHRYPLPRAFPRGTLPVVDECQSHRHRCRPGLDGGRTRDDFQADFRRADRRCRETSSGADLDSRRVGERHRGHDFESTRIDDAQHRVAGSRLDQIAGIVQTRRDDPVECGPHDRPSPATACAAASDARACASAASASAMARLASSTSLRAATPRSNSSRARSCARRALSSVACARATSACWRCTSAVEFGISNRTSRSPRRTRSPAACGTSAIRAASGATTTSSAPGAGRHDRRRVHDTTNGADGRDRRLHRDNSLAVDLLRATCDDAGKRREAPHTAAQSESRDGTDPRVTGEALRSLARGRRAPTGTARSRPVTASGRRARPAAPEAARRCRFGPSSIRVLREPLHLLAPWEE